MSPLIVRTKDDRRAKASPSPPLRNKSGLLTGRPIEILAVLLPSVAAFGLVLFDLGRRSIWLDEGDTFATASQHGSTLWHWALNDGGNMVTYYLGIHLWTALFGTSEVALRSPSLLAAVATVPTAYWMLQRLFDSRAAFFGSMFVAVSVQFVWWGQMARAYSIATFLVTAAGLCLVIAVDSGRKLAYLGYVAFSVLAIYTILLSALVLFAQLASLVARGRQERDGRIIVGVVGALGVLCVPVAVAATLRGTAPIAWVPSPGPILGSVSRSVVEELTSTIAGLGQLGLLAELLLGLTLSLWLIGVALCVSSFMRNGHSRQSWGYLLMILWLAVPSVLAYLVSFLVHPVLNARYVLGSLPAGSMLAGVVCSRLRSVHVATAAGIALVALRFSVILPTYGHPFEDWRAAVASVASRSKAQDCVAFYVAQGFDTFDYYAERLPPAMYERLPRPVLPDARYRVRTPFVLDPEVIPRTELSSVVDRCPRLWLVQTHAGARPAPGAPAYVVHVYENWQQLLAELGPSYKATETSRFPRIVVTLLDRRPRSPRT